MHETPSCTLEYRVSFFLFNCTAVVQYQLYLPDFWDWHSTRGDGDYGCLISPEVHIKNSVEIAFDFYDVRIQMVLLVENLELSAIPPYSQIMHIFLVQGSAAECSTHVSFYT